MAIGDSMLHFKLLGTAAAICRQARRPAGRAMLCRRYATQRCSAPQTRDYALPNPTWSCSTRELYDKYMRLSEGGAWRRIPSYSSSVHHIEGDATEARRAERRLFTRNQDEDGVGFEYCMFYNQAEKRTVCVFQPGPFLQGPPGLTHGGCIATIIDATIGTNAVYCYGKVLTANLNVNFRSPVPLGATVVIDGRVDKAEGRKVFTSCEVRSHDGAVLHTEATGLFIRVNFTDLEAQITPPLEGSKL